jgi:hypothetical protein
MNDGEVLPELIGVEETLARLNRIFPPSFPDRALLVGRMAARVVFVFLYGGFVEGSSRYLRPSAVYLFTAEQARRVSTQDRLAWLGHAFRPGFRPAGRRWYADTSREPIRDDLIRQRLASMGVVLRRPGVATTSSAPIYQLAAGFASLFDPTLEARALDEEVGRWRDANLSPETLARMRLKAQRILHAKGDVFIDLPDGTRIRANAGPSTTIVKALIEDYAPRWLEQPAVLWISASDRKSHPDFVERAAAVGLRFAVDRLLPDLILADLADPVRFVFCEAVATDGPVDDDRKAALLELTRGCGIADEHIRFVTAYLDREAPGLRKTFHRIASGTELWFGNEPDLVVRLVVSRRAR